MARTRIPSSAGRGTTRGGGQVGVHQTRRQVAPQPQAVMPDQVQGQGVQDAPPPVPTVVPNVALPVDADARLLNVLETLVPAQGSDNSVDSQSFLDGTLKALCALGCSSERDVELATYKLEDMANTWYATVLLGRPTGAAPLTWDKFTKLFKSHFLPDRLMQKYSRDFERLVQTPDMDVSKYNTMFCKLAIYTPYLVPTKEARVQRFVDGLVGRLYTVVAPQMKTLSYCNVVDLARKIENKGRDERATSDLRATGTRNKGRGVGDRATVIQGQGNVGRGQARVFSFTRQDAEASNVVVTCILSVCSFDALALIDPGSTHSYMSTYFALRFSRHPKLLNDPFLVSTPVGESLLAEYVYRACLIRVEGRDTLDDLIVLDMINFDMLMGMDWLSSCYAIVDCHAKIVKFEIQNEPSFILRGSQAQRLLKKGCLGLLAIVNDTRKETVSIENVPIVREFSDVFPEDLPGLPPVREIDFGIDLLPDTQPISNGTSKVEGSKATVTRFVR
ncbi:uncharacterized protein [Nicotiana sylvestris]|uniref:uncharacterized protein n=1 Tax=Nicotiana sylvestris TaxID=4096 RepID=UPI00388C8E7B